VQVHAAAPTSCGCAIFLGNKQKIFAITLYRGTCTPTGGGTEDLQKL
jgi:hypothetical protein